jgi:hypothetical protein
LGRFLPDPRLHKAAAAPSLTAAAPSRHTRHEDKGPQKSTEKPK